MVGFLLAAALGIQSSTASASGGATFTVNSNSDADSGSDGFCTLREAMQSVVNGSDYNDCTHTGTFGDDLIFFSISGSTTITLLSNLPVLNGSSLTIDGSNSGSPVVIDGASTYRPFHIETGSTLTLQNITVQHGAGAVGAGAWNSGTLYVLNSSLLNNVATNDGGAIYNPQATVTIANSTFSGNQANFGGALENNSGTAIIFNSTFSGNSATFGGGALFTFFGGASPPSTTVENTIMANSTTSEDCSRFAGTGTITGDHNIIETTAAGSASCSSVTSSTADPMLGSLTGSPAYLPFLGGSPALDAGDAATCASATVNNTSQNGSSRPQGPVCDIGAFELPQTAVTFRSVGTQDGWILESSETSGAGGTLDATDTELNLGDDAANRQYRAILSFNTGPSLPDTALITSATLKLKKTGLVGADPFASLGDLAIDVRAGGFSGNSALQLTDFSAAGTKNFVGKFNTTPVGVWYSGAVKPGYLHYISLTSGNQFRLRFYTDDNNNLAANYLRFASGNAITSSRPQLIITYYVP